MIYIFLSICCSVFVSVLLKLAKRYYINIPQAVTWNYAAAAALCWYFYQPDLSAVQSNAYPLHLALGVLLPSLFVILAASVRFTGIVRTDLAQRLSLFIPLLASFLIFSESLSGMKMAGIALGFIAIVCSIPWQKKTGFKTTSTGWFYLLIVFVGMGIIDILFKQIAWNSHIPFTSSLMLVFLLAFSISILALLYLYVVKKKRLEPINLVCGIILGIANFGNILFYLKAHKALANQPSVVFSAMNIGVIVGGALVGILIFREKLSKLNYAGIALALVSILIISLAS